MSRPGELDCQYFMAVIRAFEGVAKDMKQKDKGELKLQVKVLAEYSGGCNMQRIFR